MIDEDYAKPLDLSLFEGDRIIPENYSFNFLRKRVHEATDKCWNCIKLNHCMSKESILKCPKFKTIIRKLKQKGLI